MTGVAAVLVDAVGVDVTVGRSARALVDVRARAARALVTRLARAHEAALRVGAVGLHVTVVLVQFALVDI